MTLHDDPAVKAIRSELLNLLEQLDELGLDQAGAHLSMAIHCLAPGSFDCPAPSDPARMRIPAEDAEAPPRHRPWDGA